MNYEVRQYQEDSYNAVRNEFKKGKKKIVLTLPTGSGKAIIALKMIIEALIRGKRIAFVVDRLTLLDQFCKVVYDSGIDEFGIMQADNSLYNPDLPLQIVTAQTLGRRDIEPFDLVIWDECHVVYKSLLKCMKEWDNTYWIGLTATPHTAGMGKNWGNLVNGISTSELIKQGYLSDFVAYGPSKPDLKGVRISAGDYNKKDLADRTDKKKLIGDIIEHWFKLASDRQTVVGAVNVAHAEHICEMFKQKNVKADVIHCYLNKNENEAKKRLQDFREHKIQVLCSVDMISRGFDMPTVGCVIIARPTKSLNYHLQFLGRGLRSAPDKENCLILDHAGNIERLGFPDDEFDMELDMGDKKQNKKKEKKEKLPKPCPSCSFLTIERICPQCGFEKTRQSNVETKEGELKELQKKNHKEASKEQKEKLYQKLLTAGQVGHRRMPDKFKIPEGWASWQYKSVYGVWPAKKEGIEIDKKFYNFLMDIPQWQMLKIIWDIAKKA